VNIVIMGAGAMGSFFGGYLARAGHNVLFIARGRQLRALRERGLTVRPLDADPFTIRVDATEVPGRAEARDLILMCVKTYDTGAAVELVGALVGEKTMVLSLQNGVGSIDALTKAFGSGRILGGISWTNAVVEEPGVVRHRYPGPLVFGELHEPTSERTQALEAAFRKAEIVAEVHEDIVCAMWEKFVFICAVNGMTALTRLPVGSLLACPESRTLFIDIMREVYDVARRSGIALAEDTVERTLQHMETELPPGILDTTLGSMYFDVTNGRRLELDSLNGYVVRKGLDLGLATPANAFVYAALKPSIDGRPEAGA
jgi:2-dehydropantoate 2-reductase